MISFSPHFRSALTQNPDSLELLDSSLTKSGSDFDWETLLFKTPVEFFDLYKNKSFGSFLENNQWIVDFENSEERYKNTNFNLFRLTTQYLLPMDFQTISNHQRANTNSPVPLLEFFSKPLIS